MTEAASLNFGPAWLRADSTGGGGSGGGGGGSGGGFGSSANNDYNSGPSSTTLHLHTATRGTIGPGGGSPAPTVGLPGMKLAEYRYGREEMLALFVGQPDQDILETLEITSLLAEKPLQPLNLMGSMSEEEQRAWQRGANSDQSIRIYSKHDKALAGSFDKSGPGESRGGGLSGAGRGASRGRGLGRGTGGTFFDRQDDDPGRGRGLDRDGEGRSFGRGSRNYDRSWFDRQEEPNGSISPRKPYSRAPFDDWRKPASNNDEDEGGWRSSGTGPSGRRWNAPSSSERGGGWRSGDRGGDYGGRDNVNGSSGRWREDGYFNRNQGERGARPTYVRSKLKPDQDLPEWANDDDKGGTGGGFDASGKFRLGSSSESPSTSRSNSSPVKKTDDKANGGEDWPDDGKDGRQAPLDISESDQFEDEEVDVDDLPPDVRKEMLDKRVKEQEPQQEDEEKPTSGPSIQEQKLQEEQRLKVDGERLLEAEQKRKEEELLGQVQQEQHQPWMDVSKLVDDEPHISSSAPIVEPLTSVTPPQMKPVQSEETQWFYLDPQGNCQGPFANHDMLGWYKAGYFSQDLKLKRTFDKRFVSLQEMTKLYDRIPFSPAPFPRPAPLPIGDVQEEQLKAAQEHKNNLVQQVQHHMMVQQELQAQQQRFDIMQNKAAEENNREAMLILHQKKSELMLEEQRQTALINKLMQALSLLPNPQQMPHVSPSHEKSELPGSELGLLLKQQQLQQHQQQQQIALQQHIQQQQRQQEQHQPPQQMGAFGLGLPGPILKTASASSIRDVGHQMAGHLQQPDQQQGPLQHRPGLGLLSDLKRPETVKPEPLSAPVLSRGYDPIKSLITQLQQTDEPAPQPSTMATSESSQQQHEAAFKNEEGQRDLFTTVQQPQEPPRSIWNDSPVKEQPERPLAAYQEEPVSTFWDRRQEEQEQMWKEQRQFPPQPTHHDTPSPNADSQPVHHVEDSSSLVQQCKDYQDSADQSQQPTPNRKHAESGNENFTKKDKKVKDRKRHKENKKTNVEVQQRYIPGMEGTVRPDEQITVAKINEEERLQADALQRLQAEQQRLIDLEREQAVKDAAAEKQRQEAIQSASRLAPWAKKGQSNPAVYNAPNDIDHDGMSLAEIQKMEEERERELQMQREIEEQKMRELRTKQEEEEKRAQARGLNWAVTAGAGVSQSKSLAEIQMEEAAKERERQEREKQQRRARQKEMGLAQAGVWGSASSNLSWAGKAASNAPAPAPAQVTPSPKTKPRQPAPPPSQGAWTNSNTGATSSRGFWDDTPPPGLAHQPQKQQPQQNSSSSKKKGTAKKLKEENKVASIFKENKLPSNEFEQWCTQALTNLHAQIDIPTFMAFLNDIESPYEVNDYIKSYIGEGKGPKNFAKEYIERRSRWKNSLKSSKGHDDDLLMPAQAINPNGPPISDEFQTVGGGNKSKKKGKSGNNKKMDASHLLGFSVSSSDRVNAGDIDHPQ